MSDLSDFPITPRWPAEHPDRIQLYSYPTPNGVKISIALEELGLAYEPHKVTLAAADVKSPEFLSLNPNNKIPAIIDPKGPDGEPLALFESGAILLYLAEKAGRLAGKTARQKAIVTQWLMFQMGGIGPVFGQVGYYYAFAGREIRDPRPRERNLQEAQRLLGVLETALWGKEWIAGEYSIADIAICPWLRALDNFGVEDEIGWEDFPNVEEYLDRFLERPAVRRGLNVPSRT